MAQRMKKTLTMSQVALLVGGLGWLSGVEMLMARGAIAQDASSQNSDAVPGASELFVTPASSSPASQTRPSASLEPDRLPPEVSTPVAPVSGSSTTPSIDLSNTTPEFSVSGDDSQDYGSTYIDTTDYSIGATQFPSVVLSERSTGCQRVLRQGQAVPGGSICGSPSIAAAGVTGFPSQINAVQVGPLSVGPNGIRLTRSLNINDYYNRTQRPMALASNGDRQLMFPLSIPAMVTSPFGWRVHPIFGSVRMHTGTDLSAPMGTPVVAAYSGRVTVSDFLGGYGLTVVLQHSDQGAETLYGHLSEIFVRSGETVQQGEVIGRVGSTGNSTGPHLHFEMRQASGNGWVAVNAGTLLQSAVANIRDGFQLAYAPTEDDAESGLLDLNVPDFLQSGKNAVKLPAALPESETDTEMGKEVAR